MSKEELAPIIVLYALITAMAFTGDNGAIGFALIAWFFPLFFGLVKLTNYLLGLFIK